MSKAEILEKLARLKPEERCEVLERIWEIDQEAILKQVASPSDDEKDLLDHELADYQARDHRPKLDI